MLVRNDLLCIEIRVTPKIDLCKVFVLNMVSFKRLKHLNQPRLNTCVTTALQRRLKILVGPPLNKHVTGVSNFA